MGWGSSAGVLRCTDSSLSVSVKDLLPEQAQLWLGSCETNANDSGAVAHGDMVSGHGGVSWGWGSWRIFSNLNYSTVQFRVMVGRAVLEDFGALFQLMILWFYLGSQWQLGVGWGRTWGSRRADVRTLLTPPPPPPHNVHAEGAALFALSPVTVSGKGFSFLSPPLLSFPGPTFSLRAALRIAVPGLPLSAGGGTAPRS